MLQNSGAGPNEVEFDPKLLTDEELRQMDEIVNRTKERSRRPDQLS
jgi:hypothetical protein